MTGGYAGVVLFYLNIEHGYKGSVIEPGSFVAPHDNVHPETKEFYVILVYRTQTLDSKW